MYVRYIKILTWLQGFLVIFLYLVRFYLCSSLARQRRSEKFGILSLKPRSHVRILIYRTWAIFFVFSFKIINAFCNFYSNEFSRNKPLLSLFTNTFWSERSVQTSERCAFVHENDCLRKNCRFFDVLFNYALQFAVTFEVEHSCTSQLTQAILRIRR